ncbi:MAG TPA: ATP synthase F0 subunit C [Candidatus Saccharimonadales bacterium]|nr:ATP synthase F0 subunit C [Candidatus Saccharimonadales bacterium]
MESLAFGLTYAIAAGFAGIGVGLIGMGAMNAAGRNPEAIGNIRTLMILAISFVDALAIIGLVVALIIRFLP